MGYVQVIVQVVIAIVCAVISSYLTQQNLPQAQPGTGRTPEAKDGTPIRKIYGVIWVDDSQVCAYHDHTPIPIRKKAGKK